ncbi:MAG: hypothetical protein HYW48_00865 [Deltaproteobacteria bacterium]|nr:hypothetical protein [Deltaproteobacteria bacterium]
MSRTDLLSESSNVPKKDNENVLSLHLSSALLRKLTEKAAVEGIGVNDLASELLAEGLVLRAWEIVEKKNAMRGPSDQASQYGKNRGQKTGFRNNNNYGRKQTDSSSRYNQQSYKNIMEDGASFLEYVRSQEKGKRV